MNPAIFLAAAEHVDSGASNFACNALECSGSDLEIEDFFRDHLLHGEPDICGERFGHCFDSTCREHRVMALLLCWAMTSG